MRNIFLVIKHEIFTMLQKPSFWFSGFLFPLLMLGFNVGVPYLVNRSVASTPKLASFPGSTGAAKASGYVDQAGLIQAIPADLPAGLLKAFPDEAAAKAAVTAQIIDEYVIIPANYLQSDRLVVVQRDFNPLDSAPAELYKYVIDANLTGDAALAAALNQPAQNVEIHALGSGKTKPESSSMAFLMPMAVLFIFFFLLAMSSGFMLQSVSNEKENRTVEILLLSLRPRDLMLGKIIGLSLIALFQIDIWIGCGWLVLSQSTQFFENSAGFSLPAGFAVWALLFFLLGYLLYASLMSAIGALAPSAREGMQFTALILLPLMIPVIFNTLLIQTPDSPLAIALSLFPLTAPSVMMTRLVATQVPLWQPAVSLAGLAVANGFAVILAARFFRANVLLSNTAINWQRIFYAFQHPSME